MELMTEVQIARMLANARERAAADGRDEWYDPQPVVKLFTPWGASTWLLVDLDEEDPNIAFGLCDLGMGFPELGYVDIEELRGITGPFGLKVERDLYFTPDKTLSQYADEANQHGRIYA